MYSDKKFLSLLEDYWEEHNKLRNNPTSFIAALQDRMNRMKDGKIVIRTGVKLVTKEGESAIKEAIEFLEKQEPIEGKLSVCRALWKSAQDHADDTGPKGITGHFGSNDSEMIERIGKYVEFAEWMGENCNYSQFTRARDVVIDLLIDDGIKDRSHRSNLFQSQFTSIGVGIAEHSKFGKAVVINYASDVTPIDSEDGYISFNEDENHLQVKSVTTGVNNHGVTPGIRVEAMKERRREVEGHRRGWLSRLLWCKSSHEDVYTPKNTLKKNPQVVMK